MPGVIRLKGKGRVPGRKVRGDMNKTESAYAEQLEALRLTGQIANWWYESVTFRLADRTTYTPDFMVMLNDGVLEFHETKGFMRDDAAVKLKVAAEVLPFTFRLVRKEKSGWVIKEI